MNELLMIILACLIGGLLSMAAAAGLVFRLSGKTAGTLVAFAAGVMLSSACLHVLPEAFEHLEAAQHQAEEHGHAEIADAHATPQASAEAHPVHEAHGEHAHHGPAYRIFATLLAGLLGFFILERLALWRHAHAGCAAEDSHCGASVAAPLILIGDGFHNFVDGVLIAAAFIADPILGITTTAAVIAHEIPQELGDFILLLNAGWSRKRAFLANAASSLTSVLGGVLGYYTLSETRMALPYVLTVAAASFIYIAVADLLPLLHRQRGNFVVQAGLIGLGVATVPALHWLH